MRLSYNLNQAIKTNQQKILFNF